MDAKLLDKFEKIIELQGRAATQGEANAAASALQRLLTQHNIELNEVNRRLGNKAPKVTITSERFACPQANWMRSLWNVVAMANEGRCFYSGSSVTVIAHKGKHENIARSVDVLAATANRLAPRAYREYLAARQARGLMRWNDDTSRTWTNSYKWGFVAGVKQALADAKQEVVDQYTGGSALVLVQEKEVADYMAANHRGLVQSRATYSGGGYGAGKSAGYATGGGRGQIGG